MSTHPNNSCLDVQHDRDRVDPVGTLVELCLVVVAFIMFNMFPEKIGIIPSLTEPSGFTPLLAPDFQNHMPMLNLVWSLAFGLGVANLVTLSWNFATRCIEVALSILGIFVLVELVRGGPLTLYGWLDPMLKLGLTVAVIPASIDAIKKVVRLLGDWQTAVQSS